MIAIGNGESRKSVDINSIDQIKVGCNAIFRDYDIQHLVCVDKRMIAEALDAGANYSSLVYTREEIFDAFQTKRLRIVPGLPYAGFERPDLPKHWGSGPYAVLLAATLTKNNKVDLIGFDLYGVDGKVNNVYKDTPNYAVSEKSAVDPRYWIYQIGKVFEFYTKIEFTIYQTADWKCPKSWKKSNVKVDIISNI